MASGRKPKGKHPDKKLSPAFVHKTTKPGRYCDGNGLYLKVDPSGARRWEQRLVIQGRQRTLGLGGVQLVSLSEAREKALANRKIARAGGDPMDLRRQANIPTFEAAAAAVIELHRPSWRNAKHASQWETTLRTYVYPRLGKRPVSDIDTAEVLSVLMAIWHTKAVTARRVRHTPVDLAKSGVDEGVNSPGSDVVVQPRLRRVLDLAHDCRDDLGHSRGPAERDGLAGKLPGPGVACDDDVRVVRDYAELRISAGLHHANTEVLENTAVGHDDAMCLGLSVSFERPLPVEWRKEGGIGGRSGHGVGDPEFARRRPAASPGPEALVAQPARSMRRTACEPSATVRLISSRWAGMAWVSANGIATAAPVPRAGQTAPNR